MSIRVRYFASLRERVGRGEDEIEAEGVATVADVWARLNHDLRLPENVLFAVNMDYAEAGAPVRDGDEVAFFPPVTGG